MRIDLDYPPTTNTMYPTGKNGKRRLSEKGRQYRNSVLACVLEQHGVFKPLEGNLKITIGLIPPDRRKRDLDNCFKAILDSLGYANCFLDDRQIKEIHGFMREPGKGGKCAVLIEQL